MSSFPFSAAHVQHSRHIRNAYNRRREFNSSLHQQHHTEAPPTMKRSRSSVARLESLQHDHVQEHITKPETVHHEPKHAQPRFGIGAQFLGSNLAPAPLINHKRLLSKEQQNRSRKMSRSEPPPEVPMSNNIVAANEFDFEQSPSVNRPEWKLDFGLSSKLETFKFGTHIGFHSIVDMLQGLAATRVN